MKAKKEKSFLEIIVRLYKITIKACPIRLVTYALATFVYSLLVVAITYCTQRFFDAVESAALVHSVSTQVILTLALLVIIILLSHIFNGVENYLGTTLHAWVGGEFQKKLHKKMCKIEPVMFENDRFLDDINKAVQASGVKGCTYTLCAITVVAASHLPYMIMMSIYMFKLKPVLALATFIVFIPVLISQLVRIGVFSKLEDQSAQIRRENTYYKACICGREYYKETRVLGAFSYFMKLYKSTITQLNNKLWKTSKDTIFIEMLMRVLTLLGYIGVLLMLVYYAVKGEISVGSFAAVFASISTIFETIESALGQQIGGVTQRLGVVRNYFDFLDYPELQGEEKNIDLQNGIAVEDVSFSYPGLENEAISNISFHIKSGETIAIVGENGAGKSTLVKLLIGLYKPTRGRILIGDGDTNLVSVKSLQKNVSGVFKNYQRYKMSLRENIAISDCKLERNDKSMEEILNKVDLSSGKVTFKNGFETMLSKEFGGTDLSGGQWQRVAIARGLYKNHDIIVLDEPTAAIDPLEETKIYKQFFELAKDKLAVLVTHRMGSARIADKIIVLDDGRLVEIGNHEELIKANGKYAAMFNAQAQWY